MRGGVQLTLKTEPAAQQVSCVSFSGFQVGRVHTRFYDDVGGEAWVWLGLGSNPELAGPPPGPRSRDVMLTRLDPCSSFPDTEENKALKCSLVTFVSLLFFHIQSTEARCDC